MKTKCMFCGSPVEGPSGDLFVSLRCKCGSYGQTDLESNLVLFPGDAAEALGIERTPSSPDDNSSFTSQMDMLRGPSVGIAAGQKVVITWARKKQVLQKTINS